MELGKGSLGAADCHYNMGVLYKMIDRPDRSIEHFQKAVAIRKELLGPITSQVVNTMEELGKVYLMVNNIQSAFSTLNESYTLKKRILMPRAVSLSQEMP